MFNLFKYFIFQVSSENVQVGSDKGFKKINSSFVWKWSSLLILNDSTC